MDGSANLKNTVEDHKSLLLFSRSFFAGLLFFGEVFYIIWKSFFPPIDANIGLFRKKFSLGAFWTQKPTMLSEELRPVDSV